MPDNYGIRDWSDVIAFAVGVLILGILCHAYVKYYEERNKERSKLTETERNRRMMESMTDHCQYDVDN